MLSSPRLCVDPTPGAPNAGDAPSKTPESALALLVLVPLLLVVFHDIVLDGRVLYWRDIHLVWEPLSAAFVRGWRPGSWPLWDDGQGFGQSLVANPQAQVFYPPTWLALVLPFGATSALYVVGHLLGSGMGLFFLGRRLGLSAVAAVVSAALWVVSGPFASSASLWHHFAGVAWAPWVLLGLLAMRRRGGAVGVGLAALPVAGQILAGSADLCALTLILGATLLLALEEGGLRGSLRHLGQLGAAVSLALGLTAAQWLSSLQALLHSARADLAAATRTYWSVHPAGLLDLVLPIQMSSWPLRPEARAALYEGREPFVPSLYLGLVALPVVLAGLAHRRRRLVWLFVGISAAALLMALGRHAPFYAVATSLVPPLRILRYPVKAVFLVALSWPLLAGLGVDVWLGDSALRKRRWGLLFAGLGGLLALLALALPVLASAIEMRWLEPASASGSTIPGLLGRHLGAAAAALLLASVAARTGHRRARQAALVLVGVAAVIDLTVAVSPLNPSAPASFYAYRPAALRAVQKGPPGRTYVYNYAAAGGRGERHRGATASIGLRADLAEPGGSMATALAMRSYLFPASASSWGVRYGFDLDMTGLAPREVVQLTEVLWATEGTPAQLRLLQLGGVSQMVTLHDVSADGLVAAGRIEEVLSEPVRLWRVPHPLPRYRVVGGVRVADPREAIRLLTEGRVEPRREVVLTEGMPREPPADFHGSVEVLEQRPGFVQLRSTASHPAHVVILDAWAPGWTATVDGHRVPVLPADGAFRALAVPAGHHTIESRYLPASVIWGGGLGVAFGLLALGVLVRSSLRLRQPRGPTSRGS